MSNLYSYNGTGWDEIAKNGTDGTDGVDGSDGSAATITVGSTTTLTPGSDATVSNSGTSSAAIFDFGIPQGAVWYTGSGAPSTTHNNGDLYLNTSNGDVYKQTSGSWGSSIANLTGPTGSAGSASGSDTQVQFNDGGSFAGDTGLTYNKTTNALAVSGDITANNLSGTNTGDQTSVTGNAGTATKLATARNLGVALGTTTAATFDGSANQTSIPISGTLAVGHGGTGATTLTGILKGNGTSAVTAVTAPSGTIVGTSDSQTLTNKTLTSPVLNTGVSGTAIDTDGTLTADSDTKLASQKAIKTYVDTALSTMNADIQYGYLCPS